VSTTRRQAVVEAALALQRAEGIGAVTMRRLGAELGVDPALLYREFRSKDEILHELGDRILGEHLAGVEPGPDPYGTLRDLCLRLRAAHLAQPRIASLVRSEPPRRPHEERLTDLMLGALRRIGLGDEGAVAAYHALVALTVGGTAIDAPVAQLAPSEREALYERWRADYHGLDAARYPDLAAVADLLYRGPADARFAHALELMLAGLAARAGRSAGG
jgi:AcrR family transcriptional regulator